MNNRDIVDVILTNRKAPFLLDDINAIGEKGDAHFRTNSAI